MIQEQQQQTNQWVLTPVQFNLVGTSVGIAVGPRSGSQLAMTLIVKTQHNSTHLKGTLKQLVLELRHSSHVFHPPQTFQALLDQLEI